MNTRIPLSAALAALVLTACGEPRAPDRRGAAGGDGVKVLATVNGVPITERDLEHRARKGGMGALPGQPPSAGILETIVRDELVYQQALRLGLDRDPSYRARLDDLEAQLRIFQRQEMAVRLRAYAQQQAPVTPAEAQAYFDANAASLRTRFHVYQILHKGNEGQILAERDRIRAGAPFEEVAAKRFEGIPLEGKAPWDLGELSWYQLPPAWRGVVDRLEPGQVSDVIRGEAGRYWIVKLVAKRADPAVTFATEQERITELLRQREAEEIHAKLLAEARKQAKIVYVTELPARTAQAPAP